MKAAGLQLEKVRIPSDALHLEIHKDFCALDPLREAWDKVAVESGSPVYMSYDWVKVWWQFYNGGRPLRLLTTHANGELVGVVPMYIDTFRAGPLRFRVARIVGDSIPPHLLHPPVRDPFKPAVFDLALRYLLEEEKCDCFSAGPLSDAWEGKEAMLSSAGRLERLINHVQVLAAGVHSVFALPGSYEEYLAKLSKGERKHRRDYELRHLRKDFDVQIEVVSAPGAVGDELERFMVQHAEQWRLEHLPGHFRSWPRSIEFNRALVQAQGKLQRLRFIRIIANNQVISNQYVFAFGNTYHGELLARAVGPEWDRFSLGRTTVAVGIQNAIQEGVTRLDGGIGHYDFKVRMGAQEFGMSRLRFVRNSPTSLWKARLYGGIGRAVSVGYHKIWYRRVRSRLPLGWQRPHSFYWLRFGF